MNTGDSRRECEARDFAIRLLVIDDDPDCLQLITDTLLQDGLEILAPRTPKRG